MPRPTDIVELLRIEANATEELHPVDSDIEVMRAAAIEIERLRAALVEQGEELACEVQKRQDHELSQQQS